jgi:hypothetical protein
VTGSSFACACCLPRTSVEGPSRSKSIPVSDAGIASLGCSQFGAGEIHKKWGHLSDPSGMIDALLTAECSSAHLSDKRSWTRSARFCRPCQCRPSREPGRLMSLSSRTRARCASSLRPSAATSPSARPPRVPAPRSRCGASCRSIRSTNPTHGQGRHWPRARVPKQIADTYGGRIWVESTLGQGSTLQMEFPTRALRKAAPDEARCPVQIPSRWCST